MGGSCASGCQTDVDCNAMEFTKSNVCWHFNSGHYPIVTGCENNQHMRCWRRTWRAQFDAAPLSSTSPRSQAATNMSAMLMGGLSDRHTAESVPSGAEVKNRA